MIWNLRVIIIMIDQARQQTMSIDWPAPFWACINVKLQPKEKKVNPFTTQKGKKKGIIIVLSIFSDRYWHFSHSFIHFKYKNVKGIFTKTKNGEIVKVLFETLRAAPWSLELRVRFRRRVNNRILMQRQQIIYYIFIYCVLLPVACFFFFLLVHKQKALSSECAHEKMSRSSFWY